jgi:hypothetical protein
LVAPFGAEWRRSCRFSLLRVGDPHGLGEGKETQIKILLADIALAEGTMLSMRNSCPIRQRALDTRLMRLFGETNTRPNPSGLAARRQTGNA